MPSLSNSSSARIVVVGAGAAGLGCAWQLARAGHDVTLVDRGEVGKGALWASGGMLAAGFEASVELDPRHELAEPFSSLLHEGLRRWPQWIDALQAFSRRPLGFNLHGSLTPVFGDAEKQRAGIVRAQAERFGVSAQWADQDALSALEPNLAAATGAIVFPNDGQLDNRVLGLALAGGFYGAGGRLELRTGVKALLRRAGHVAGVVLSQGKVLEADFVVLATGASTLPGTPERVVSRPVKGQMIGFSNAGHLAPRRVVRGFSIYVCAKPGGRLIAGATVEPGVDDLSPTDQETDTLLRAARRVIPGLEAIEPDERWSGLRPAARDLMPVVGQVEPGLITAGGGYRNGVLLTPVMAEAVCSEISGGGLPDWARPFAPQRASLRARRDH